MNEKDPHKLRRIVEIGRKHRANHHPQQQVSMRMEGIVVDTEVAAAPPRITSPVFPQS
ncbi:hypothetical protein [Bifidobacterium lemurum]|uniref:hypothetical protein n=1 Tax=Bifidobacterium lemurum TaxID=1603886 RepID=UPI0013565324|nr:hypothetical protein [Bifidobacterium lemurum]